MSKEIAPAEQIEQQNWIRPGTGEIVIGDEVDFAYIVRKDTKFATAPIANNIAARMHVSTSEVSGIVSAHYDTYFANLVDTLHTGLGGDERNVQVHIFDPEPIDNEIREKAAEYHLVSLDPLFDDPGIDQFEISRGYVLDGTQSIGQIARPGFSSRELQVQYIASRLPEGIPVAVTEDDLFTGETLRQAITFMVEHGIPVEKIIPGIQVGDSNIFDKMGIQVDPVVKYKAESGDIFDKCDLGDPRDFVPGLDGLVTVLPQSNSLPQYGRAPYIQPSVSPSARVGILPGQESNFSMEVMSLSHRFFQAIGDELGTSVRLEDVNPESVGYFKHLGYSPDAPMIHIMEHMVANSSAIWADTQAIGLQQKQAL